VRQGNSGLTLGLIVIALPALVGAMGLAMDVGNVYLQQHRLQTADDAAVLAGAFCLPSNSGCVPTTTASNYAANNGINTRSEIVTGPTVGTAPDGNPDVSMTLKRTVPYYFARLVGINSVTVQVASTAEAGAAVTVFNAFPVGLQECLAGMGAPCPYVPGSSIVTFAAKKNAGGTWVTGPGDWSALALGNDAPDNTVSICPPPAATCINSDPGWSKTQAVVDEAENLIGQDVVVPLVDWTGCTGSCNLNIYGFAEIQILSSVDSGPNSSLITGEFVNYVDPGVLGTTTGDVGTNAEVLIQ
jgi:Flp pilus assembly protein TadG